MIHNFLFFSILWRKKILWEIRKEKGLHFFLHQKEREKAAMCVIQFVQISIFKLDIFRFFFVYTLPLSKTNKSSIPWNKLTFPLSDSKSEKVEKNKTQSVREIYSTFPSILYTSFSISSFRFFSSSFSFSFSLFLKKHFLPLSVCST